MKLKYIGENEWMKRVLGDYPHICRITNSWSAIFLHVVDIYEDSEYVQRYNSLRDILKEWEEVDVNEQ